MNNKNNNIINVLKKFKINCQILMINIKFRIIFFTKFVLKNYMIYY